MVAHQILSSWAASQGWQACRKQTALLHRCTPAEDPEITQQLNELRGGLNDLNSQVIGTSLVFLNGERVDVRNNETNLGAARVGVMARGAWRACCTACASLPACPPARLPASCSSWWLVLMNGRNAPSTMLTALPPHRRLCVRRHDLVCERHWHRL